MLAILLHRRRNGRPLSETPLLLAMMASSALALAGGVILLITR